MTIKSFPTLFDSLLHEGWNYTAWDVLSAVRLYRLFWLCRLRRHFGERKIHFTLRVRLLSQSRNILFVVDTFTQRSARSAVLRSKISVVCGALESHWEGKNARLITFITSLTIFMDIFTNGIWGSSTYGVAEETKGCNPQYFTVYLHCLLQKRMIHSISHSFKAANSQSLRC